MAHAIASHVSSRNVIAEPGLRLDGVRITAGAGAIAVNAVILLVLMAPMALPEVRQELPAVIDAIWIEPDPPEVKVVPVEVTYTPKVTPQPAKAVAPPQTTTPPLAMDPQPGDTVAAATEDTTTANTLDGGTATAADGGDIGIASGAVLQHLLAPPPAYPRKALVAGATGTVILRVRVDVDGHPLEVSIAQSSGHRELDHAARRQVQARWVFRPATQAGHAVQAIGLVPVEFKLD